MYYTIGAHTFSGKDKIREHARRILDRHEPESPISGPAAAFLKELLARHPNYGRKVGVGVREIFVRINWKAEGYENRCFWIRREDGTETDFSYTECIWPTDHRKKFLIACRNAIREQVREFRDGERARLGKIATCPVTGREFAVDEAHVDHVHPNTFESLVD